MQAKNVSPSDGSVVSKKLPRGARQVARGFEELNIQELQKDSPTCASESLRLLLSVICQNQWQIHPCPLLRQAVKMLYGN